MYVEQATDPDSPSRLDPYAPAGLLRRATPFLLALGLAYALLPLELDAVDADELVVATATLVATLLLGAVLGRIRRLPHWVPKLIPFLYLAAIVALRDAYGGTLSGAGSLLFLAPFWVGLYDSRRQVVLVTLAMFCAQAGPGLMPADGTAIRRSLLSAVIIGFISLAVNRTVGELRTARRSIERESNASAAANAQLAESNDALERSNRELEQFAYVTSHDLQEPLRMIRSFSQLFVQRHGDAIDPEGHELLGYVLDGSARAQQLVQDLLEYSRLGTTELAQTTVDLDDVLDRALASLRAAIDETGATIERIGTLPTVEGDALQLERVFANLISNSLRYHHPDRAPVVTISAHELEESTEVRVEDNGIGFDPVHADRIFLMFQRLHRRDEYDGTGIGLAICARIVERHGGVIVGTGRPGEGATFSFTLGGAS